MTIDYSESFAMLSNRLKKIEDAVETLSKAAATVKGPETSSVAQLISQKYKQINFLSMQALRSIYEYDQSTSALENIKSDVTNYIDQLNNFLKYILKVNNEMVLQSLYQAYSLFIKSDHLSEETLAQMINGIRDSEFELEMLVAEAQDVAQSKYLPTSVKNSPHLKNDAEESQAQDKASYNFFYRKKC